MFNYPSYVVIAGPTASGKSALALALAERIGGEIVGCDSVQVYRGFDVGSAKPSAEEMGRVRHHLIDVVDWNEDYDAARYARDARKAIGDIKERKKIPVVVGGTGLYLRALLQEAFHDDLPSDEGLRSELRKETSEVLYSRLKACDPKRASEIHPNDRFRVVRALELNILLGGPVHEKTSIQVEADSDAVIFILDPERATLHERIALRTAQMLKEGLMGEVSNLIKSGVSVTCKPMESIGYKQAATFLKGTLAEELLFDQIKAATRQYAKRQSTWFRKTKDALVLPQNAHIEELLKIILAKLQDKA
jgi:tRNA dimethylallyltransferase